MAQFRPTLQGIFFFNLSNSSWAFLLPQAFVFEQTVKNPFFLQKTLLNSPQPTPLPSVWAVISLFKREDTSFVLIKGNTPLIPLLCIFHSELP